VYEAPYTKTVIGPTFPKDIEVTIPKNYNLFFSKFDRTRISSRPTLDPKIATEEITRTSFNQEIKGWFVYLSTDILDYNLLICTPYDRNKTLMPAMTVIQEFRFNTWYKSNKIKNMEYDKNTKTVSIHFQNAKPVKTLLIVITCLIELLLLFWLFDWLSQIHKRKRNSYLW
jgi:hypothetical protein